MENTLATAISAPSFTALDELLALICEELQISESRFKSAERRYHSISDWLDADDSPLHRFSPTIYPQGSMAIGTTIPPIGRQEYDLDMVCEFRTDLHLLHDALYVLDALEARLLQHGQYQHMLKRKKRCITVEYANDFHLDILPAKPDSSAGNECVVVPDRKLECWVGSNPRGYAQWFLARAALRRVSLMDKAAAAPIPQQEQSADKPPLKLTVQLWKRWRDVKYGISDLSPRSIILTTLAAHAYSGEPFVSEALQSVLDGVTAMIPPAGRLYVYNPMNPKEDFSESWDDPMRYQAFLRGLREFRSDMAEIRSLVGPELAKKLEAMFGEYVKPALEKRAARVEEARKEGNLRMGSGGVITTVGAGIAIPRNNFYGE
jgi:Second Messenger Oligonucleotide or Dinucleotide Synthetase domain